MTSIITYRAIIADMPRSLRNVESLPEIGREIAYWKREVGKVRSLDDLIRDKRLLAFALRAFGLSDMNRSYGLIRKLLAQGIDDPSGIARRIADRRFRDFAACFDFRRFGAATTSFDRVQEGVVQRYIALELEERQGRSNETVRLALYFRRMAVTVDKPLALLADRALLEVARTAAGLPTSMSGLDLERQIAMLDSRISKADLSDPVKLERLIEKFCVLRDMSFSAGSSTIVLSPTSGLLGPHAVSLLQNRLAGRRNS